jgi:hypothetical protein
MSSLVALIYIILGDYAPFIISSLCQYLLASSNRKISPAQVLGIMSVQASEILPTSKHQRCREFYEEDYDVGVVDDDNAILYEEPYGGLLSTIV